MEKKVLITSRSFGKINDEGYRILEAAGYSYLNTGADFDQAAFEEMIPGFDALIIGAHPFPAEVLARCEKLKIICKHGAGLDNIPLDQAKKQGVIVCNAPGTNSNAVADLAFGLMLSSARLIQRSSLNARQGIKKSVIGTDVYGKTLGLLGFGAIAKCVSRRAAGFSMRVLAYDPYVKEVPEEFASFVTLCGLDEVIRSCDILSIHMPLTDETRGMIGATQLAAMREGSILINTARGGIVDEKALGDALRSGHLMAAALDVVEDEPLSADHPLMELENVILTPHIGMYSKEAVNAVGLICARNVAALEKGEPLQFRVV